MKSIHYVTVFVVRPAGDGHELLLGLRAPDKYMGGTWQLISGGIEPDGETAWKAAVREVHEETGLVVAELYRLPGLAQFYRSDVDAVCLSPYFAALVAAGAQEVCNPEHSALRWVPIAQAEGHLMWPDDRAALGELRRDVLVDAPVKQYLRVALPEPPAPQG